MEISAIVLLLVMVGALLVSTPLLGTYLATVYGDAPERRGRASTLADRVFGPVESLVYRVVRVDPLREQRWTGYASALLSFSAVSVVVLYALQRLQGVLPLNPDDAAAVPPALAWNTAISFVTNTNWQNYAGETTMSHLTQMSGLAVQNFVSAAVGMSVAVALIRGLVRRSSATIGNFWVDVTRTVVRVLLPLSLLLSIVLMSQGVIQNLRASTAAPVLDRTTEQVQTIPGGPVASQEAITQLGTNGGGPLNANASHPFENPNGLTNFLSIWAMLAIPFALTHTFGTLAGDRRQGRTVFGVMFSLWLLSSMVAMGMEARGNPALAASGADQSVSSLQSGGNLEGKEVRFGAAVTGLYAASTTGTSSGAVIGQHDSFTALGGGVALLSMMLGEVSPGGVGVGLNGLLILALLAVFIAGLMVGRTPEFLGKKIQAAEMKLVVLYILVMPSVLLAFAAVSVTLDSAVGRIANPGPHGLSEILYAFSSAANNNGSAFGGLGGNTQWFNTTLGIAMFAGRFLLIIPTLAIAGALGRKAKVPVTAGTFPTNTPLFAGLTLGVTLIVAGLTFFPALALGPIVEHLSL
ncbi:MAG: potassium-transporting ATPase subunit KdpA [Acidimicrobiales bacterium]|nr:potassium-transporting ATPase subunit KdpA [Acidimicrobiales bacterium]